jgi:ATP synthase F1 delta subunit
MNLAYKYANAFLNVYRDRLNDGDIKSIATMRQFLSKHPRLLFLLQVPSIKKTMKEKWLGSFCQHFNVSASFKNLITLLLSHRRVFLLPAILKAIIDSYQKRHHIEHITIKSSIPLPLSYRHDVESFIKRHIKGIHYYHYEVDPTLIAGIRIQSDTILWEYSMNKRLRDIAHANSCEDIWKKIQI